MSRTVKRTGTFDLISKTILTNVTKPLIDTNLYQYYYNLTSLVVFFHISITLSIFNFNYVTDGMNLKVSIGLRRLSGSWKWNNGESLSITHPMLSSSINNYDMSVIPCTFNYCGIFQANSFVDLRVHDNCCNNLLSYFVCSSVVKFN